MNGVVKQKADLSQMIWSVAEQISKLSEANELFPGDIIYSGTPENVGQVFIPIAGSDQEFPVRRIYCIGRNYAAHAREMGSDPTREPPFFFQKPTDAIQFVAPMKIIDHPYPSLTKNYHYEVELVAALNKGGKNIPTVIS